MKKTNRFYLPQLLRTTTTTLDCLRLTPSSVVPQEALPTRVKTDANVRLLASSGIQVLTNAQVVPLTSPITTNPVFNVQITRR